MPILFISEDTPPVPYHSIEEERDARTETVTGHMRTLKAQLPSLLKRLNKMVFNQSPDS